MECNEERSIEYKEERSMESNTGEGKRQTWCLANNTSLPEFVCHSCNLIGISVPCVHFVRQDSKT